MELRSLVETAFESWRTGEAAITDLFAPEMTWEITGSSAASRRYASKAEFVEEVLGPFGRRFGAAEPFRPVTIRAVIADDDRRTVVVLWDGRGTTIAGTVYENTYAWAMRFRDDGLVVDGVAFYDSPAFDRLWVEVAPA